MRNNPNVDSCWCRCLCSRWQTEYSLALGCSGWGCRFGRDAVDEELSARYVYLSTGFRSFSLLPRNNKEPSPHSFFPTEAQNDDGDTALHWAVRSGLRGIDVVRVLLENGCRAAILNNSFKRAIDSCADGFSDEKSSTRQNDTDSKKSCANKNKTKVDSRKLQDDVLEERRQARANLLNLSFQSRTLVLHHPECLEHIPKSTSDWECPDRVTSIMRRVLPDKSTTETTGIFPNEVTVSSEFDRAKLDFLSRVHSSDYLSFVNDLSKELTKRKEDYGNNETGHGASVVPFTPMVQKTIMKDFSGTIKKDSKSDTSFSAGSLRAARRAAGAVQHAVDW